MATRIEIRLLRRRDLERIGLERRYITKLVRSGVLPSVQLTKEGRMYFRKEDVERILGIKL